MLDANLSSSWRLWEVFVRSRRGLAYRHVGSLRDVDGEMALQHAREVYTRRCEGIGIWVVPSEAIKAMDPAQQDSFFETNADKPYRYADYYEVPEGVEHL